MAALLSMSPTIVSSPAAAQEAPAEESVFINAIAASVDGNPITLSELCNRLNPPRKLSLKEAASDQEARQTLELMIMEKLIKQEASARKLVASEEEINQYLDEIARRNGIDVSELGAALASQNKNLEEYKKQVELDILKSKLANAYIKGGVSVSRQEIDAYLEEHPELKKSGTKVRMRQIFVSTTMRDEEAARDLIEDIRAKAEAGEDFATLASSYSEGPEAPEGGKLDLMTESDMNPELFDAIFSLKPQELSRIVKTQAGLHLFKLEERVDDDEEEQKKALEEEVTRILKQQKNQDRMNAYFSQELYKLHSVDKKI